MATETQGCANIPYRMKRQHSRHRMKRDRGCAYHITEPRRRRSLFIFPPWSPLALVFLSSTSLDSLGDIAHLFTPSIQLVHIFHLLRIPLFSYFLKYLLRSSAPCDCPIPLLPSSSLSWLLRSSAHLHTSSMPTIPTSAATQLPLCSVDLRNA